MHCLRPNRALCPDFARSSMHCEKDPLELFNVADDPAYIEIKAEMLGKLTAKMAEIGDEPAH